MIVATVVGPLAAVLITRWRDNKSDKNSRQMNIFRTLMATRRVAISYEHVAALNQIEVEFYGITPIEDAWRNYIAHLNNYPEGGNDNPALNRAWDERRADLLAVLLARIATCMKMPIGEIDIRNGGYAPQGWGYRDWRMEQIQEFVVDLRTGRRALPVIAVPLQNEAPQNASARNETEPAQ